jgi:UDP-glucose 6-dehydrogenase
MPFAGTLLLIDNQTVPGLKSYEVEYQKVWADQNINMSGEVRSTMQGIRAVLVLTFGGDLRENDVSDLATLLNQDYFGVTFFDPLSKTTKNAQYYSSDYSLRLADKLKGRYETIDIELLPVARYS